MAADQRVLCPSARCSDGAYLLGVVQADGRVAISPAPLRVDTTFVTLARRGVTPEARFRFASPCQRDRCRQWTGAGCGVVDAALAVAPPPPLSPLPPCAIRPTCRWFQQAGAAACGACPQIVTELVELG